MILRDFEITDLYKCDGYNVLPDVQKSMLTKSLYGVTRTAYTLEHKGEIIAIGGIIKYWPGVYEAWALLSKLINKYPIITTKHFHVMIRTLEEKYKIRRLQTMCLDIKMHKRWLEYLGFEYESTMKGYGINGETYLRYVRLN